jgi:hypothetical protein
MRVFRPLCFAFAVSALVFASSVASAESAWLLGAKGGFNDAKLIGDPVTIFINRPGVEVSGRVDGWQEGFVVGGFARRNFSEFVGLQFEVLFS